MQTLLLSLTLVFVSLLIAPHPAPAENTLLLDEPFNVDTSGTAATQSVYPGFTYAGAQGVSVVNGQVNLPIASGANYFFVNLPVQGDITVEADVSKEPGGGAFNAGIVIGNNRLIFHPGMNIGAFRVEGPGGFFNQNMGFTPPAFPAFSHVKVTITGTHFDIAVTDGPNPNSVYSASFDNPGYVPGDKIGFTASGPGGRGIFDNLKVISNEVVVNIINPNIINLDASQNNQGNPVLKSLSAGTYRVHVLGTSEGGQFDAWNDVDFERGCDGNGQNCNNGWETRYYFKSPYNKVTDSSCRKKKFGSCRYETAAQAAANAPEDVEFTLSTDAEMKFYIYDSRGIEDNQGGLSLQLTQQ